MKPIKVIISVSALCIAFMASFRALYAQENTPSEETVVTCTAESPVDGSMWMGTNGDGIYRLGKNGSRLHFSEKGGKLGSDTILYICFDSRGKLWIVGANGTLTGYTAEEGFKKTQLFSDEISGAIYLPKEDKILIASVTKSSTFNTLSEDVETESELPFKPVNLKLSSDSSFVWIFGEKQVAKYDGSEAGLKWENAGEVSDLIPLEFETYSEESPSKGGVVWIILACALGLALIIIVAILLLRRRQTTRTEVVRRNSEAKEKPKAEAKNSVELNEEEIAAARGIEPEKKPEIEEEKPAPKTTPVTKSKPVSTEFTTRVLMLISEHYPEPDFDVDSIAALTGMSRIHVNRKLKAEGSPSPSVLIKEKRMEVAKYYLLQGDIPMSKIASECGFRSPSYFTTAFKEYTGLTPSEFIAQNRL